MADYFSNHLGSVAPRTRTFDWNALGYVPRDLSMLEVPFSQEEIKNTINSMPFNKAPGPDGFTGAFFKACWEIIKEDVTAALNSMFMLNSQGRVAKLGKYYSTPKEIGRKASVRL